MKDGVQEDFLDTRTLFVRGLGSEVGDAELTEAFSAVGPVRHGFVVKDPASKRHKGYGFVQFALQEDAEKAMHELHGTSLAGRKLKVETAKRRASVEERKSKRLLASEEEPVSKNTEEENVSPASKRAKTAVEIGKNDKGNVTKGDHDKHRLVRTIALGGLASDVSVNAAIKLAKDLGVSNIQEVTDPAPEDIVKHYKLHQDGCSGYTILLRFETAKEAMDAVAALHGKRLKSPAKSVPLKKQTSGLHTELWARQVSGEGLHLKRWRLVIHNLSFSAREEDIKEAFSKAGFVWEVTLPRNPDGTSRGFAFVGFICRAHAEKAVSIINGTKIKNREVAVDWALSKREYVSASKGDVVDAVPEIKGSEVHEDQQEAGRIVVPGQELGEDFEMDEEEEKGMVKNVLDDILGATENQDQEAKDMKSTEITPSTVEDKNVDPLSRKAMSAKAHDADAVKRINARVDKLTSGFEKANNKDDQKKSELVDPQAVVFIRGLPLDVTRQELYASMQAFGPVASARLVLNKVTGKLKGTAFVDFRTAEGASSAVEACAQWRAKKGSGVVIKGRNVEVDPALDGQGAREISMKKVMTDAKEQDRRNIYLSQEGIIEEGMPAWERLSMSDRNKRRRAREEMKTKLKSPNFSVSKTRLNIRNVPRQWVESQLKQLCIKAVKERAKLAQPKIVQVKILRESEESSRGEEKGRSKGIAFVEFVSHEHALCALRQLNNNPKVWGEEHRPIVEFAVDDVRALKKREAKRKHALALRDGIAGASQGSKEEAKKENGHSEKGHSGKKKKEFAQDKDGDGLNKPEEPKSKRKLRQERRRMLKQRQRAAQGKKPPTVDASAQGLADDQVKKKSQRRRELRKRKMGGSESGNSVSKAKAKTSVDVGIDIALASGSVDGRAVKKRRVGRKIKDKDRLDELAEVYLARQYK